MICAWWTRVDQLGHVAPAARCDTVAEKKIRQGLRLGWPSYSLTLDVAAPSGDPGSASVLGTVEAPGHSPSRVGGAGDILGPSF